jgi:uncharacterized delta-60 repeat protein
MRKTTSILLFLMISFNTNAQNPADIDSDFNIGTGLNGGITYTNVYSIVVQPNGKIILGGDFNTYNGITKYKLIRLNTDGSIDTTFNVGTGFINTDVVFAVALQSDGKILVGGDFPSYNGNTAYNYLVRLNTNGTLDTSFNSGGSGFNVESYNNVRKILVQPDNKILVAGSLSYYNNDGAAAREIIRLNPDGSKDTNFNDPNLSIGINQKATIHTIDLQSDNKIVVGGDFTKLSGGQQNSLVRLNINGLKDNSFNIGTGFNGTVFATIVQSDGKILVGGLYNTYNGNASKYLERLNTDGSKDINFAIGTGFEENNPINAIKLQTDGKILVGGGFRSYNGNTQNGLIRLNTDGTKDNLFDVGLGFSASLSSSGVNEISIQSDNKILVGGTYSHYYNNIPKGHIVRLLGDSILSTDFFIKETISLFPNPTSDYININGFEPNESATIINLNGQVLKSIKIDKDRINVSDLKIGIYFVKIKNVSSKFIKK